MMFITSQLFTNSSDSKMVGIVTSIIVIIRVGEIMFDPMIGGVVDNTNTRWEISPVDFNRLISRFNWLNFSLFGLFWTCLEQSAALLNSTRNQLFNH